VNAFLDELSKIAKKSDNPAVRAVVNTAPVAAAVGLTTSKSMKYGDRLTESSGRKLQKALRSESWRRGSERDYRRVVRVAKKKGVSVRERNIRLTEMMKELPKGQRKALQNAHPILTRLPIPVAAGPLYAGKNKSIYTGGLRSGSVAAHELGHATGVKALQSHALRLHLPKAGLGVGALLGARGAARLARAKGSSDKEKAVRDLRNASLSAGIGPSVVLAEEARATGRALRAARRKGLTKAYAKTLGPAFGTYAGQSLRGVGKKVGVGGLGVSASLEAIRRYHAKKARTGKPPTRRPAA